MFCAVLNIAYPVTIISRISEGITTIFAISSYSVNSIVSAIMPINMIVLSTPTPRGFKTWVTPVVEKQFFKKIMVYF